ATLWLPLLWWPRILPFGAWPLEIGRLTVEAAMPQPSYEWSWRNPGGAVDLALVALARIVGASAAWKILVSLTVLALPFAMLRLLERFGRSPWLALFALPFGVSAAVASGDVRFSVAACLFVFALAETDALIEWPTRRRNVSVFGLAL